MEIPVFSELKSGIKIAVVLACITIVVSAGITAKMWYNGKIDAAVKQATISMQLDYAKEYVKLQNKSDEKEVELKAQIDQIRKEKDEKIKIANGKYNVLSAWVDSLPKQSASDSGSGSQVSSSAGDSEDGSKDIVGILRRQDAINLAEYGFAAEETRLNLLACYAQYDSVRETLEKFKADNRPASLK